MRRGELSGVKWEDIDFATRELHIRRSIVKQRVGRVKTEASEKPVPLSEHLIAELLKWRHQTAYAKNHDYVFASHIHQGRQPYWMSSLMQIYIKPAAERIGVRHLKGWHTLRHYPDFRTIPGEGRTEPAWTDKQRVSPGCFGGFTRHRFGCDYR